jgi:hypothetical protein
MACNKTESWGLPESTNVQGSVRLQMYKLQMQLQPCQQRGERGLCQLASCPSFSVPAGSPTSFAKIRNTGAHRMNVAYAILQTVHTHVCCSVWINRTHI